MFFMLYSCNKESWGIVSLNFEARMLGEARDSVQESAGCMSCSQVLWLRLGGGLWCIGCVRAIQDQALSGRQFRLQCLPVDPRHWTF